MLALEVTLGTRERFQIRMDDHVRCQRRLLLTDVAAVRTDNLLRVRSAPFIFGQFLRSLADVFHLNVVIVFFFNVVVGERHLATIVRPLEPVRYETKQFITICTKTIIIDQKLKTGAKR